MKNSKRFLAIIILAIVAFVSCKKDNENILNAKDNNVQQSFDYRQIEDKITYFKDFRQKMADSKTDEAFNLEDAAWHLACLANLDFCKVNVEYNSIQFDTVEMQVNVTDGVVLLNDLGTAYEQMHEQILQFKKGFTHNDQNLYFINASINADGNAKVALMCSYNNTSKDLDDHLWYFEDEYSAYLVCNEVFTSDSTYYWNTTAKRELQRILNLFEHYENNNIGPGGIVSMCYFPTQNHIFKYPNCPDPYGSPFFAYSRTFTAEASIGAVFILSTDHMCYCLDSYLGLGYDYLDDYSLCENEHPVNWVICDTIVQFPSHKWPTSFHKLKVEYGQLITANPPGPNDD
jgi:hypothetical protein